MLPCPYLLRGWDLRRKMNPTLERLRRFHVTLGGEFWLAQGPVAQHLNLKDSLPPPYH